jgi:Zn-dependent M28 family amino/carboxypeptidase
MLTEEKAAVTLEPSRAEHGTMFVLGRDSGDDAVPSIVVAAEHYNMIARLLARGEDVELAVNLKARFQEEDTSGYNVIAEIPGTDPDIGHQVVMIGAHLDSWHSSPGAADNADGCAVAMEAMRILKTLGVKPRRTIRVALWAGEEEGLLGSREWVEQNLTGEENLSNRENFSVYFNLDPGGGPIYGFFLEENEAAWPIFSAWLEPFRDLGATVLTMDGIGSTDHVPFIRAGVPGFEAVHDYVDYDVRIHHTNMDTYERIREEDLKQASVITASLLYHAAMRDGLFPRKAGTGR